MKSIDDKNNTDQNTTNDSTASATDTGVVSMQDQQLRHMEAMDAPAAKLDADFYNAADTNGVAEGLFGSGNLNYLTLQAQQNDLAGNALNNGDANQSETAIANIGSGLAAGRGMASLTNTTQPDFSVSDNFTPSSGTDGGGGSGNSISALAAVGQTATAGASNTAASTASANDSALRAVSSDSSSRTSTQTAVNGQDGTSGTDGTSGVDGSSGTNGTNGVNGTNGTGGGGDTFIDIDNVNVLNDLDILNNLNLLNNLEILNNLNILNNNTLDISFLNNLDIDILNNLTNNIDLSVLNNILNDLTINIFNPNNPNNPNDPNDTDLHIDLGLAGPININPIVDIILDPVEALVGDIDINIIPDLAINPDGSIDLGIDLDALVANLPLIDTAVDLGIPSLQAIIADPLGSVDDMLADVTDAVDDVLNSGGIVGDILGDVQDGLLGGALDLPDLSIENTVQDVVGGITDTLNGILGNTNDPTDTDLHVDLGLAGPVDLNPVLDVVLDPVEALIGDIDINVLPDIALNADGSIDINLGLDAIVADIPLLDADLPLHVPTLETLATDPLGSVTDIVGDLTDGLSGALGGDNSGTDTDLHIDLGLAEPLNVNPVLDVVLDPVENLVGDIDINVLPDIDLGSNPAINVDIDALVANTPLGGVDAGVDLDILDPVTDILNNPTDLLADPAGTIEELTSDLTDSLLGGNGANGAEDSDLNVLGLEIPLDPIENIVGDIDIDVDLDNAIDTLTSDLTGSGGGGLLSLGDIASNTTAVDTVTNILDTLGGSTAAWPESPVNSIVDTVFSTVTGGGDAAGALPLPIGTVAEGLGILNLDGGSHSGSGGGHHHGLFGGLFG